MIRYDYVPACKYLALRPIKKDMESARFHLLYFLEQEEYEEMDDDDIKEHVDGLLSLSYRPICEKNKEVCVVLESPVMSMKQYGELAAPMPIILKNSRRLDECSDREFPENSGIGSQLLPTYLMYMIKTDDSQ
jgi:hypothetical protein